MGRAEVVTISWAIRDEAGEVLAAGRRRAADVTMARAYDEAVSVAEAIERALIDLAPDHGAPWPPALEQP